MILALLLFTSVCGVARGSLEHVAQGSPVAELGPAHIANAPVVTAASSQYFQRTFNRLVVPQPVPVVPVAPAPTPQPVIPVASAPPVFVEPTQPVPVTPTQDGFPTNVAIAVATAHAAAPVATILLPPYPFGYPPNVGFLYPEQPIDVPDENTKESTTPPTKRPDVTTTKEPEQTTPLPFNSDDNVVQALPSNENINFNQYGPPLQGSPTINNQQFPPYPPQQLYPQTQLQQPNHKFQPQQPQFAPQFPPQVPRPHINSGSPPQQTRPQFQPSLPPLQSRPQQQQPQYLPSKQLWSQKQNKPLKLRTSVEVVPVPLAYITPPPLHKTHAHVKVVKHVYAYVPATSAKIILRPVNVRSVPVRLVKYKNVVKLQNLRANARDIEVATISSFLRPNTKPPRV